MSISLMAIVLWAAGFFLNAALFFVLLYKRRYRTVPWFTAWIGTELIYNIPLFLGYRLGSKDLYAVLYWSANFVDVLLQVAVVLEIARCILWRSGRWVEGSRLRLGMMASTAPLVAFGMAWFMNPAAQTRLDALLARTSLFTTILICLLFSAVVIASQQLGLGLRSHVMRESYGLILWSLVAFITDTLHAYWRTLGHFTLLENVRIVFFQAALIYWSIAFWRPEPEARPVTKDTIKRLNDLAARLEYAQTHTSSPTRGAIPK